MSEERIKNFKLQTIGFIETKADGTKIAKDFYRKKLGEYNPKTGYTKDFYGRIVAHGDATTMLINLNDAKKPL